MDSDGQTHTDFSDGSHRDIKSCLEAINSTGGVHNTGSLVTTDSENNTRGLPI